VVDRRHIPDRVELPPKPPPRRALGTRFPWATAGAVFAPAAGLAAATGLQRWLEGPLLTGDAVARWLWMASAVSLMAGAVLGVFLSKRGTGRALWVAWGAAAPWALALATLAGAGAVRPIRDGVSALREAQCRADRRPACTAREFAAKCRSPEAPKLLGPPAQTLCRDGECTHRYRYDGPWTPDDRAAEGSLMCSVVVDAARAPLRYALAPGPRVSR
jgi:hypothetical protein